MILGTIRDNLLFGDKDATEKDMHDALNQANAQFVYDNEEGLDTFVGTAGIMNMSGGQKQRIAIARALIKRPKILILDEATSALDPKSEVQVQAAIEKIANSGLQMTIIIIAHRLTTIESADNLLYFKSRSDLVSASKGTPEYDEIFEKLKCIQYAYGEDEKESDSDEDKNGLDGVDLIEEDNDEHSVDTDEANKLIDEKLDRSKKSDINASDDSANNVQHTRESQVDFDGRPSKIKIIDVENHRINPSGDLG